MNNSEQHIIPIELLTKFLAKETSSEEQVMVEEWIKKSPDNEKEFKAIQKLWGISYSARDKQDINIDAEWSHMQNIISPHKTRIIPLARIVQIAAVILIISGLAFIGLKQSQFITHKASIAYLENIELPDGSIISLNAKSKITYSKEFGESNREITLKGEAFFEVTKNNEMPFIVTANDAKIEVVGTQFNIKAYKNQSEVKVTVTEGIVKLSEQKQASKKTILTAGETGTYDRKDKAIKKIPLLNTNDISWKTRILSFNNSTLQEVVDILKNTYQANIIVSETVKDCAITVEFENKDLPSVLKVLKSTLDLSIKLDGKKIYISGVGCP